MGIALFTILNVKYWLMVNEIDAAFVRSIGSLCLTAMASQASCSSIQTDDCTCPSSHTNYCRLTNDKKSICLHRMQQDKRLLQQQLRRLQDAIAESTETHGVLLDEELQADISELIKAHTKDVHSAHEEGTFQQLFWEQQSRANTLGSSTSIRWHPLIIK